MDHGIPIYKSYLFDKVFPHRIELRKVMRQDESQNRLKNALDELRKGKCDRNTEEYLCSLERKCELDESSQNAIHIYFRKLPVQLHNFDVLSSLPGELVVIESKDTGMADNLETYVNKFLTLKVNCRVMLLYSINDELNNGFQGNFVGFEEDQSKKSLLVNFPKVGTTAVNRRT